MNHRKVIEAIAASRLDSFTVVAIAKATGCSRWTVYRTLHRLQDIGYLSHEKHWRRRTRWGRFSLNDVITDYEWWYETERGERRLLQGVKE